MSSQSSDLTLANYPLSSPFCLMIEVIREGERKRVSKTFDNWALAAHAAGAALERLLPPQSLPQWRTTIDGMKTDYTPKIIPKIAFASGAWSIDVYPEAWMNERKENGHES
jgi:hypothetical protein